MPKPEMLESFLATEHGDPILKATAQALKKAVRLTQDSQAAAIALASTSSLDLSRDPLFGGPPGPGLDVAEIVAALPGLKELKLGRNILRNPDALSTLLELRVLYIAECGFREIGFLSKLLTLEELDVSKNCLASLAPLKELGALRKLKAAGNLIDDLAPLAKLRALKFLDVSENRVDDLSPLQDCFALTELHFRSNRVRSLKPLKGLRDLYRVGCGGNPLYDDDFDVIPRNVRID